MDQVVGFNCSMMIVNLMKMVNKTKNQSMSLSDSISAKEGSNENLDFILSHSFTLNV